MKTLLLSLVLLTFIVGCTKENVDPDKVNLHSYLKGKTFIGEYKIEGCDLGIQYFSISEVTDTIFYGLERMYHNPDPSMGRHPANSFKFEHLNEIEEGLYEGTYTENYVTNYVKIDTKNNLLNWSREFESKKRSFNGVEGAMSDYRPSLDDLKKFEGIYEDKDGTEFKVAFDVDDHGVEILRVSKRLISGNFSTVYKIYYSDFLEWDSDGSIVNGPRWCQQLPTHLRMKENVIIIDKDYSVEHDGPYILTLTRK